VYVCVYVCVCDLETFLRNTKKVGEFCSQNFLDCHVPIQIRDEGCVCVCVCVRARARSRAYRTQLALASV